jgi:hypothetical protein
MKRKINEYLSKLIKSLVKKLIIYESKFLKKKEVITNQYEDLAPVEVDEKTYTNALEWAIQNDRVKNIALTGIYGSGKSSILHTFQILHPEYKILKISLATFPAIKPKDSDINLIERSILQQFFYAVHEKEIPDSRFKRIKQLPRQKLAFLTVGLIIWLFSINTLIRFDKLFDSDWLPCLFYENYFWVKFISLIFFLGGLFYFLYKLIRLLHNARILKLNLKDGDFEINPNSESSILNKHLDEILYFFQTVKYDIVIIEDLDRFDNLEIFTRLREINNLINNSSQINKHIPFIYAVKDTMFQSNTITKFFDFIIPIIPVVNSSNSLDKLHEKFKESKIVIEENFLNEITLFIDDLRHLKNIFNEFLIYKQKLGSLDIDSTKLFAIITYKNFCPEDFEKLHKNEGLVYDVINNKKTDFIQQIITSKNERITILEEEISLLENSIVKNERELKMLFTNLFIGTFPNFTAALSIGTNRYPLSKLSNDDVFEELIENSNYILNVVVQPNSSERPQHFDIALKSIKDDEGKSYSDQLKLLQQGKSNEIQTRKREIEKINHDVFRIGNQSISELINDLNIEFIDQLELRKNDLLFYLVANGYIDENYHLYISYFYGKSFSKTDMEFVTGVINSKPKDFNFKLTDIDKVIGRIRIPYFEKDIIYNISLVDFLLKNEGYNDQIHSIVKALSSSNKRSIEFFDQYLQFGQLPNAFIDEICKSWPSFWRTLLVKFKFSEEKKNEILLLVFETSTVETIKSLNVDSTLYDYLIENNFLFNLDHELNNKVKQVIKILDLQFDNLDTSFESVILHHIIEVRRYKLSLENIEKIIGFENPKFEHLSEGIQNKLYSTIMNSECQSLIDNVTEDILNFLNKIYFNQEKIQDEEEDCFLELLNDYEFEETIQKRLIGIISTELTDLSKVTDKQLWSRLLTEFNIVNNWDNLLRYYIENEEVIDEYLTDYINTEIKFKELSLLKIKIKDGFSEVLIKKFCHDLILNENLQLDSFMAIKESIPYSYNASLDFSNLSSEKIEYMISSKLINLTEYNYNLLREHFDELNIQLIKLNLKQFLVDSSKFILDDNEMLNLLSDNQITHLNKVKIIEEFDNLGLNENTYLASILSPIIILEGKRISDFALEFIFDLIRLDKNRTNKLKLANLVFKSIEITDEQVSNILDYLGGDYLKIKIKRQTIKLEKTIENIEFSNFIKNYFNVSSVDIKDKNVQIVTKRK